MNENKKYIIINNSQVIVTKQNKILLQITGWNKYQLWRITSAAVVPYHSLCQWEQCSVVSNISISAHCTNILWYSFLTPLSFLLSCLSFLVAIMHPDVVIAYYIFGYYHGLFPIFTIFYVVLASSIWAFVFAVCDIGHRWFVSMDFSRRLHSCDGFRPWTGLD